MDAVMNYSRVSVGAASPQAFWQKNGGMIQNFKLKKCIKSCGVNDEVNHLYIVCCGEQICILYHHNCTSVYFLIDHGPWLIKRAP